MSNVPLLNRKIIRKDSVILKHSSEMEKDDLIPCVSDTMFKIILGNESKKKNTAYFLSFILNRDMKEIEDNMIFLKNEQDLKI